MVETETTTTGTELDRLITFDTDADETLVIRAGRDEMDNRTIFKGHASGRYAVVPVNELAPLRSESYELVGEPQVEDLRIIGETTMLPESGLGTVSLVRDGEQISNFDNRGVYGLLWLPYK